MQMAPSQPMQMASSQPMQMASSQPMQNMLNNQLEKQINNQFQQHYNNDQGRQNYRLYVYDQIRNMIQSKLDQVSFKIELILRI